MACSSRLTKPVADGHPRERPQIDTAFHALQPLIAQLRIGIGNDRKDGEGAIEFVDRRLAQPAVGRAAQGHPIGHMQQRAAPA